MKTFLKMLLATLLGGVLLIFLFFVFALSFASLADKEVVIKDNSILSLDLTSQFVDRAIENPFSSIDPFTGMPETPQGLNEVLASIKSAKNDDRILGIYLKGGIPLAGHATLKEIRDALIDFKTSGKFIYGYSEILTQKAMVLTSVADTFFVNPEGVVEWSGLSSSVMYYQDALNKLGVKPVVLRATGNKFKSAVEPFLRQDMSEANREQLTQLLGSIWQEHLNNVSKSTGKSVDELNSQADTLFIADPENAAEIGLIKATAYYDQVLDVLMRKTSTEKEKDIPFISIRKYASEAKLGDEDGYSKNKIAVIYAQGDIVDGAGGDYSIGSTTVSKAIRQARTNDKVKAIVLRVNSPGGSALASEVIWREIDLARKVKPVIASMGDLAASGGYYISCYADTIIAQPNTITGSIGAFGLFFTAEELLNDKLGVNIETVKTNKHSDLGTIDRSLTASEQRMLVHQVDVIYGTFKERVAEGRGMTVAEVDSIGQGRVWSGRDALQLGLVDMLGGLDTAIAIAANKAGVADDYRVVEYPEIEDPFTRIIKELSGDFETKMVKSRLGNYARYFDIYENAKKMEGFQTRLEYDLIID